MSVEREMDDINANSVCQARQLWEEFRERFFEQLQNMEQTDRSHFWHVSSSERTKGLLRCGYLLERVCKKMKLKYDADLFRVDAAFCDTERCRFPVVLLESENAIRSAWHEVATLMSFAVPLRVLITFGKWDRHRYPKSRLQSECCTEWEEVIKSRMDALRSYGITPQGILGFLIGECDVKDSHLRYYSFAYDLDRECFTPQEEKDVGIAPLSPTS